MCTSCVKNTNIFLTTLLCFILGDIGYYDEDGHLIIKDRMKELIKVKGHQVKSSFVGTNCYSTGSHIAAALLQITFATSGGVVNKRMWVAGKPV